MQVPADWLTGRALFYQKWPGKGQTFPSARISLILQKTRNGKAAFGIQ